MPWTYRTDSTTLYIIKHQLAIEHGKRSCTWL